MGCEKKQKNVLARYIETVRRLLEDRRVFVWGRICNDFAHRKRSGQQKAVDHKNRACRHLCNCREHPRAYCHQHRNLHRREAMRHIGRHSCNAWRGHSVIRRDCCAVLSHRSGQRQRVGGLLFQKHTHWRACADCKSSVFFLQGPTQKRGVRRACNHGVLPCSAHKRESDLHNSRHICHRRTHRCDNQFCEEETLSLGRHSRIFQRAHRLQAPKGRICPYIDKFRRRGQRSA